MPLCTFRRLDMHLKHQVVRCDPVDFNRYASKLDGTTLPAVLNGDESGAPMWRGNLVRELPFRAEADNSSIADLLASGSPEIDALTNEFMDRLKVLAAKKLTERG